VGRCKRFPATPGSKQNRQSYQLQHIAIWSGPYSPSDIPAKRKEIVFSKRGNYSFVDRGEEYSIPVGLVKSFYIERLIYFSTKIKNGIREAIPLRPNGL